MVDISVRIDPTLAAADTALEEAQDRNARPYLGMSAIGVSCARKLWYSFRWCQPPYFNAATLKKFADGHYGEDVQAARLRMVPGVALWTEDPNKPGEQIGYDDHGGHFSGHMDGVIQGLLQAPKTPHVWEHKQVDEKKQRTLKKLIAEAGEKSALKEWSSVYYAQAQVYMHYSGLNRHYLTVATAGGRHTISCRTEADPMFAKALIGKAERIINAQEPPAKISDDPDYYECNCCEYKNMCHGNEWGDRVLPTPTCRTCLHSTPELIGGEKGRWSCALWQEPNIPEHFQRTGCDEHRYIPVLLAPGAYAVDADPENNTVVYVINAPADTSEVRFHNGPKGKCSYLSRELHLMSMTAGALRNLTSDELVQGLREEFGAEIVGSEALEG